MDWTVIFCLIFMNTPTSHGNIEEDVINQLLNYRRYKKKSEPVIGTSLHPDVYTQAGDDMIYLGNKGLRPSPGKLDLSTLRSGFTKLPRSRRLNYRLDGGKAMQAVTTFLQKLFGKAQEQLANLNSPLGRRLARRHIDLGKSQPKRHARRQSKQRDPPGHRLIKPTATMLKSAANYPRERKESRLVYGNMKNLGGIPARNDPLRIAYSDFRKKVLRNSAKKNNAQRVPAKKKKALRVPAKKKKALRVPAKKKTAVRVMSKKHVLPKRAKKKQKMSSHPTIQQRESKDKTRNVYGNMDNLGIIYAKTPFRVRYSDFRRFGSKDSRKEEIIKKLRTAYDNGISFPGWRRTDEDNYRRYVMKKSEKLKRRQKYSLNRNLGSYGNEPYRVKYTNFRSSLSSSKPILDQILDKFKRTHKRKGSRQSGMIILHGTSLSKGKYNGVDNILTEKEIAEEHNDASEILDDEDALQDYPDKWQDFRKRKVKSAFRNRTDSLEKIKGNNCSDGSSESSDSGSTQENNPGNPYTIHKNKYKTNWIWNLAVTGDHMNINPYGPQFANQGPSGAQLFFGRKWWYFNQDDYKPFR